MFAISKGWILLTAVASRRFRTIKICPKDVACVCRHSRLKRWHTARAEGARHERHDLEGRPGEAGLDAAIGHRMGDGLCNRDYPACPSVGKRSGVRPAGSCECPAQSHALAMREPAYELLKPLTEVLLGSADPL